MTKGLAGIVFNNLGWKLASVVLALLLWFALVGEQDMATSVSAPVEFKNIPKDLEISSDVIERLRLEIQGPAAKLTSTALAHSRLVLDLRDVSSSGERTFSVLQSDLNLPAGVALNRAVPAQVRLRFERRVEREVPVKIRLGDPATAGYRVTDESVEPGLVRVIGPESRVLQVRFAETDPIDLGGVTESGDFQTRIFVNDPQVRLASSPMVRVKVKVEKVR